MPLTVSILAGVVTVLLFSSCASANQARAVIKSTAADQQVVGEAAIVETKTGLDVDVTITDLPPGKHAIHIHEKGSCADAGNAAGGHFNPDKVDHGFLPKDGMVHAHPGDMGNLDVGADRQARLKISLPGTTLKDGRFAVAGLSVIVHEKEDDFSQPTGNAGGRIACGIIEMAEQP